MIHVIAVVLGVVAFVVFLVAVGTIVLAEGVFWDLVRVLLFTAIMLVLAWVMGVSLLELVGVFP